MYPDPLPSNPVHEEDIWQGPPHHSEFGYAQAKRGMLAQLQAYDENFGFDYTLALATNLYGFYDRFNTETGHVIPSLIKKFFDALHGNRDVVIWGDGSAERDFLYAKDAARSLLLLMEHWHGPINLATGVTHAIREAVDILADYSGTSDRVVWDTTKPNGQLRRAYDVTKLKLLGFVPSYDLSAGLKETYDWYTANHQSARIA